MIHTYQTGAAFLEDNRTYLDSNPYLSDFLVLDSPLLKQADRIDYAMRCMQDDKKLLALKVEPYNLQLFGEACCVPELLRFLFDGGYEIKNYLCESELGQAVAQQMQTYGRRYEEALAMDFMEADEVTEPSCPEVEPAQEADLDEVFACMQRFIADCGLLDTVGKDTVQKILSSIRLIRKDGTIVSMARASDTARKNRQIALVYTLDAYRGKGYARKVVNTIKNEILAAGMTATLNVDRKNPISYHLYQTLGFRRVFSQGEFRRMDCATR